MSGRYAKGMAFENDCQHYFEDLGYVVIRSAGSHGPIDLICGKKDEGTIVIQCRLRGNISKDEIAELREWAEAFSGARILLAYRVEVQAKGSKRKKYGKEFKNL